MCCFSHGRCWLSRVSTVLTWPPKLNSSSRIRAHVARRFLLAHWAISISSLGVVLLDMSDLGRSSTIPVTCKRCIRRSITEWYTPICHATCLLLKPAYIMPTCSSFDWQHICYLWWTCFSTHIQHTYGHKLCSTSRPPNFSFIRMRQTSFRGFSRKTKRNYPDPLISRSAI